MASDENGEKTELPTDRRRTQAREQGNIARSTDLAAAVVLMGATSALYFFGPEVVETLASYLRSSLTATPVFETDIPTFTKKTWQLVTLLAASVLPLMLVVAAGSLAINLAQAGFLWSPEALMPKFERLNPLSGAQRIVSIAALVKLGGSLFKLVAIASIAYWYVSYQVRSVHNIADMDLLLVLAHAGQSTVELGYYLSGTLLILAILDYGFQWWKHEQDMMMTKQELREEMKDMDGDPHTRMRRREAHRKLTEGRNLQAVKTADVVITNPTELAIAIKYDPATMPAPTIVAKGADEIAAQIRKIAAEHGIPIIERKPLARALYKSVKVGQQIPAEMYDVFIEILAYVYRITGRQPPMAA
ncbi:flagellar biosynthesis protein FlhB [Planctellipticum variicoloris]|uniref:flagellar biosynthesis protein FlhB n=1 Tax=Planctellipticum variicoloris TaxID=3064265 RepID=UPI0030135F7B|nr:flagellar biosynthesis protein FlhB [Planctomycetaceae bacterium SH412]